MSLSIFDVSRNVAPQSRLRGRHMAGHQRWKGPCVRADLCGFGQGRSNAGGSRQRTELYSFARPGSGRNGAGNFVSLAAASSDAIARITPASTGPLVQRQALVMMDKGRTVAVAARFVAVAPLALLVSRPCAPS